MKNKMSQSEMKSVIIDGLEQLKEDAKILKTPSNDPITKEEQDILNEISDSLKDLCKYFNETIKKVDSIIDDQKNIDIKI